MLWLALHLPLLPLEACCASLPPAALGAQPVPVVLMDQHRVHSVNRAAAERGVRPGMKRSTALALAADLLVADNNAVRDADALQAVVHVALAFTPSVCLQGRAPEDRRREGPTVLLEVQGSLRLFGGLPRLHQQLLQSLAPLGHRVQVAAAPTALGAALLSQWAQAPSLVRQMRPPEATRQQRGVENGTEHDDNPLRPKLLACHAPNLQALQALLSSLPLDLLSACRPHADVLLAMGLHSVADLQALPRTGVARRFGQAVLDELDRALGLQKDPQRWMTLPPVFESRLELVALAENTDQVLYGAGVLLARLVAWAQAHQGRVASFTLRMLHESRRSQRSATPAATELQVSLAEPALDPAHLQLLLRERLAHCVLAAPTLELQLLCRHLVAAPAPNGELFPSSSGRSEGLVRLLERLGARLGAERVHRVLPVADHRPERWLRTVPAQGPLPSLTAAAAAAADVTRAAPTTEMAPMHTHSPHHTRLPLHRPAWLLPEPLPLAERDALPLLGGRALVLVSGPERIETGWWDTGGVARDYYIGMDEEGSLLWLFRGRLPSASGEVHWYLQGRFA